jgi:hypothetical protein
MDDQAIRMYSTILQKKPVEKIKSKGWQRNFADEGARQSAKEAHIRTPR